MLRGGGGGGTECEVLIIWLCFGEVEVVYRCRTLKSEVLISWRQPVLVSCRYP